MHNIGLISLLLFQPSCSILSPREAEGRPILPSCSALSLDILTKSKTTGQKHSTPFEAFLRSNKHFQSSSKHGFALRKTATMPTKNVVDERISKFKTRGRIQQISACVELRKANKDENFLKRRNISVDLSSDYISNEMVASLAIEDIIKDVNSNCRESQTRGCQAARKLLSQERNPPLKEIIDAGLLVCFVSFLSMDDEPNLQFEAAWALTNIASGTSWHTQQCEQC
ncbi:hypothetical protein F7725_005367 [Dissostichus mawsoni]|uniref:IBB domain-containing protein n=1 Tax=Dissostichus mawsoni TaxID=36200 RepID=A0A7J5YR14_DISMA|nr:hypothetical protein F7725_005367 [Dissostichus mawsoni]